MHEFTVLTRPCCGPELDCHRFIFPLHFEQLGSTASGCRCRTDEFDLAISIAYDLDIVLVATTGTHPPPRPSDAER